MIYAPPNEKDKDDFWFRLTSTINNQSLPCIVMGDFNEILTRVEKLGGNCNNLNRFKRINNLIQNCNLIDIESRGNQFTWRKKKDGDNNIFEKLDRVLAHFDVINAFHQVHVWNHAFTTSDHCMISVELSNGVAQYCNKPFRFELMWTERKDCEQVIKQTWRTQFPGTNMYNLVKKLNLVKSKIKLWSKLKIENINKQMRIIDQNIGELQKSNMRKYASHRNEKIKRLFFKKRVYFKFSPEILDSTS